MALLKCLEAGAAKKVWHLWDNSVCGPDGNRTLCGVCPSNKLIPKNTRRCRVCQRAANGEHDGQLTPAQAEKLRLLLLSTRKRAAGRGLFFNLDWEWLVGAFLRNDGRCQLTGVLFREQNGAFHKNPYAPSIDRIDAREGYRKSNCRLVCAAVNMAINEWGHDIFSEIASGFVTTQFA